MQYRVEITLSPAAMIEHLQAVLDAAAEVTPAALRAANLVAGDLEPVRPGTWALVCDPGRWASHGTPLWVGLLNLERQAGHDVWMTLGPVANHAGYRVAVAAGGDWRPIYHAG